ncbi:MAG: RNA polymerase sigma factor, partial [Thermomicrobiales bacterium]|nr:RNA polymerase sigma factor [Thermomicrobiales bacterium]
MPDTDVLLLERWATRRDADAFAQLVARHSAMVYRTCRRILRNASDAEEVSQECFLQLAGARAVPRTSLGGWLHSVAVTRALDRLKSDVRRQRRETAYMKDVEPTDHAEWAELQSHVDEAIAALPEKFREPIVRRYLEGATQDAVGRAMGLSRSTVQYRLDRGVDDIRRFLKRRGIPVATAALLGAFEAGLAEAAPVTLTATLGKLALSGSGALAAGAGSSKSVVLGGALIMKK